MLAKSTLVVALESDRASQPDNRASCEALQDRRHHTSKRVSGPARSCDDRHTFRMAHRSWSNRGDPRPAIRRFGHYRPSRNDRIGEPEAPRSTPAVRSPASNLRTAALVTFPSARSNVTRLRTTRLAKAFKSPKQNAGSHPTSTTIQKSRDDARAAGGGDRGTTMVNPNATRRNTHCETRADFVSRLRAWYDNTNDSEIGGSAPQGRTPWLWGAIRRLPMSLERRYEARGRTQVY